MSLNQALLAEYDQECATTRKCLERVPEDKLDWKPHEKSMTLAGLASHVVELLGWTEDIIRHDSYDMAPPSGAPYTPLELKSRQAMVETFDKFAAAGRQAIASARDEELARPWSLLKGGQPVFTMPKIAVLRTFVLNHCIHHRGQLSVYLRLQNVPVPSIYGPSADEGSM